jgi:hypothetical protein
MCCYVSVENVHTEGDRRSVNSILLFTEQLTDPFEEKIIELRNHNRPSQPGPFTWAAVSEAWMGSLITVIMGWARLGNSW